MNTDDPQSIAQHISDNSLDTTVRRHDMNLDGTCWFVENEYRRLAIGVDPIDGGGISWASYGILSDGEQSDPIQWGGWEFGQDKIAAGHIEAMKSIFNREV